MRKARFSEEQITYALKQVESGRQSADRSGYLSGFDRE